MKRNGWWNLFLNKWHSDTLWAIFFFGWRFRYVMRLCRYDAIFYSLHSIHNASRLYLVFALFTLVPAILSPKHVPTFPRLYFLFFFLFCSFAAKRALSITRFSTRNFTLTIFFFILFILIRPMPIHLVAASALDC